MLLVEVLTDRCPFCFIFSLHYSPSQPYLSIINSPLHPCQIIVTSLEAQAPLFSSSAFFLSATVASVTPTALDYTAPSLFQQTEPSPCQQQHRAFNAPAPTLGHLCSSTTTLTTTPCKHQQTAKTFCS
ncbi:hypothetical protein VNO80_06598 [Phaseolus coccineus]|uniref:Uncharacterized protein n=1 Tax=Phaseolus coccineus TaxID=3886 RepID=A0AAN9NH47_PHACN